LADKVSKLCVIKSLIIFFNHIRLSKKRGGFMNIEITDSAKEKLLLMKEKNMPITLMKYPVG